MIPIRNRRLGASNSQISKPINTRPIKSQVNLSNSSSPARSSKRDMIDLYTCPGIGDALWPLFFLLKNSTKKIKIHTLPRPKNFTAYFLNLIQNVVSIDQDFSAAPIHCKDYFGLSGYSEHMRQFTYSNLTSFDHLNGHKVFMTCNQHVDYGRRLEDYLPNMQIDFKIPWTFDINPVKRDKPYIVFITSASEENTTPDVGPTWKATNWNKIAKELKTSYPDIDLIWAGNNRDVNIFNGSLDRRLFTDIKVGADAKDLMNLMAGALGHIAFQNGVSVISVYENVPTYFLIFPRLERLKYSWTQPGLENNKTQYNPVLFSDVTTDSVLEWVENLRNVNRDNI